MTEFITRNYGNENFEIIIKTDSKEHYKATENFARGLIDHAKPASTIEAKPDVHAHWIELFDGENPTYSCSNCMNEQWRIFDYCPYCGAQMDELVSNTDELNSSEKPNSCDHIAEGGKKESD